MVCVRAGCIYSASAVNVFNCAAGLTCEICEPGAQVEQISMPSICIAGH